MNINWQDPFKLAFEMGLAIIGWSLVLLVALLGIAVVYALGKSFYSFFTKKPKENKVDSTYQEVLKDLAKSKNIRLVKDE